LGSRVRGGDAVSGCNEHDSGATGCSCRWFAVLAVAFEASLRGTPSRRACVLAAHARCLEQALGTNPDSPHQLDVALKKGSPLACPYGSDELRQLDFKISTLKPPPLPGSQQKCSSRRDRIVHCAARPSDRSDIRRQNSREAARRAHSGNPAFRRPSISSFAFVCPPRAIHVDIVKAGSSSSRRAAASRVCSSRLRQ